MTNMLKQITDDLYNILQILYTTGLSSIYQNFCASKLIDVSILQCNMKGCVSFFFFLNKTAVHHATFNLITMHDLVCRSLD